MLKTAYNWLFDMGARLHLTTSAPFLSFEDKHPGVRYTEIQDALALAEPGDIVLTRVDGYASNLMIPGFWKHCLMVTDTSGYTTTVEARHQGVITNTGIHSMAQDYACLLRPQCSDAYKALAVARIESIVGLPYDRAFEFDIEEAIKELHPLEDLDQAVAEADRLKSNKRYQPAFSCSEALAYAYWPVREELGIERSKFLGKDVILPHDFWEWSDSFELIWYSKTAYAEDQLFPNT